VSVVVMMAVVMMAVVVMAMMMMMVVPDHAAHLMKVEAVLDEIADDPRAVMMMERLAGSRIADDERERGRCRKQGFPEHDFLRLMDVGRGSNVLCGHAYHLYAFASGGDVMWLTKPARLLSQLNAGAGIHDAATASCVLPRK
jgi:hypothetical protein